MHFSGIYFGNGLAIVVALAGRFASWKDIFQTTLVALTIDCRYNGKQLANCSQHIAYRDLQYKE